MADKPSPESVARAARLREQIDKLINPSAEKKPDSTVDKEPMSPHEFIERRMRELDRKK